ncbi:MAG: hypothetical protein E7203_09115 [Selenomonas ruminantium]|uniref:SHOCT domain-containing protein n=1 Tax=Selenomonas ruminantium TaxID=971 RepID=A0A927WF65_SELRU|nr:hypothetical protein [Selenomonas ruminantium]MBE6085592.1 hypothetical protein [Selenomonas ruminantium]
MFKVNHKKIAALALAGVMSFGIAGMSMSSVTEAAHHEAAYEDGTHNEYSHRMQEEERVHRQNILSLRYELRHGKITQQEFDKKMKHEQNRHDEAVKQIKADYERQNRHHH